MTFAKKAERTYLEDYMTKDSDFVELQQRNGAPPKIIWVTCGNTSNAKLKSILLVNLREAVNLLETGEILVEITG
jgi:predicted nuclease of predicted toxin-antitoxin system